MTTYYIFRHGETFATKGNSMYWFKIKSASILPEGIPSLEKIGSYLKTIDSDYNACSEYKRCRQTVDIMQQKKKRKFVYDSRLNEYFLETLGHFQHRIKDFINEVEEKKYKTVIICTHGMVIGALKALLTQNAISLRSLLRFPSPGVLTIIKNNQIEEINFNEITKGV